MSLPSEMLLATHFGHLPEFKRIGPEEWHSGCPECGGKDRFFMRIPDGMMDIVRGKCRRPECGYFEPVFEDSRGKTIDASTKAKWREEQEQRLMRDDMAAAKKRRELSNSGMAVRFHEQMKIGQREEWYRHGLLDNSIERYRLGYVENRRFGYDEPFYTDALTIPLWYHDWEVSNIQFRLLNPPDDEGKYRPLPGRRMELFYTIPNRPLTGTVVLMEGAKKAMVTAQYLWEGQKDTERTNIVAVPSKMPSTTILRELVDAERIFVVLDPDAYEITYNLKGEPLPPAINRLSRLLHMNNPIQIIHEVDIPVKADDFFYIYDGTKKLFKTYFQKSQVASFENKRYPPLFR